MNHADGPRRVDTLLWSGITKVRMPIIDANITFPHHRHLSLLTGLFAPQVDRAVPTDMPPKKSLIQQKREKWAADKQDTWHTAYKTQYNDVAAESLVQNGAPMTKVASLSKNPLTHKTMGLRGD